VPTATVLGTRLHYLDVGVGDPTVMLLHAFPLHSAMWHPQLAALAASHRVLAPDFKGFGESDAPDDPGAYSMDAYADELAGLLSAAEVEQVVLVGLSLGGYVSFAFRRRHGEAVAGLVLADTRAAADSPEVAERRVAQQRRVREEGTAGVIGAQLGTLLSEPTRQHRPAVVDQVRRMMQQSPAGFVGALEAMRRRSDSTADLAGIDVPTLVLAGEYDLPSPPAVAEAMAGRIPGARLAVLPEAGHLSNLEAPEAFNQALLDFLAQF